MITETYKAWLAGFFDGEGSICFANDSCKHPRVVLYQRNQRALFEEVQKLYGGSLRFMRSGYSKGVHGLNIERQVEILKFLSDILPYLRIKHEKASLMIAFCSVYIEIGRAHV